MQLDLRTNGNLPPDFAELFNIIAYEIRRPFTETINELSRPFNADLDWWMQSPAGRNIYDSPLFHYCCTIRFIKELLINRQTHIDQILVDSTALKKIIQEILKNNNLSVPVVHENHFCKYQLRLRLLSWLDFSFKIFDFGFKVFLTKIISKSKYLISSKPLTLVDIFIIPNFIENDRYYPGFWKNTPDDQKKTLYFVPTFSGFSWRQLPSLYRKLRMADKNFLLKEDFLKLPDYLYALGHIFRIRRFKISKTYFSGVDISPLVTEEIQINKGFGSALAGILNYCFFKRLKETGIKIAIGIDWFENQPMDKGWNLGLNTFYPGTKTLGYLGMIVSDHYLPMFPTTLENDQKLLPKKLAVVGKSYQKGKDEFFPNIQTIVAPAFRFQCVWRKRQFSPDQKYFTVLVGLYLNLSETKSILEFVNKILKRPQINNIRYWIKPHPATKAKQLKDLLKPWPAEFTLIDGPFEDWIEKADVFVATSSSTCIEAIAMGVPVIIAANPHGLTHNPIPNSTPKEIWQLCRTPDKLTAALEFFHNGRIRNREQFKTIGEKIRKEYFHPVSPETIRKFLSQVS